MEALGYPRRSVTEQGFELSSETTPPPPSSGGAKYAIIGLLLLGGAAAIWFATAPGPEPEPIAAAPPDAAPPPQRSQQFQPDFVIPDEEPDAGEPDAAPVKRRIVYVDRRSQWDCSGDIPAAAARAVVRENQRQVRNCYERRLKVDSTIQGRLNVRVKIGSSGSVGAVRVSGSLRDAEVSSCVRNLARRWSFPSPTGGACAVLDAPFNLTPRP